MSIETRIAEARQMLAAGDDVIYDRLPEGEYAEVVEILRSHVAPGATIPSDIVVVRRGDGTPDAVVLDAVVPVAAVML